MSRLTTHDRRVTGARLRGRRSCTKEQRPGVPTRPDPRFLRYLAEHRALPVDLAAALLRCSKREVMQMVRAGSELGWIRSFEYLGEPCPWAALDRGGWTKVGRPVRWNWRPSPVSLPHRRELIEVRLALRDEKPGWAWISETDVRGQTKAGAVIPDGVLKRGDVRWAIEVERSRKAPKVLRRRLERLCDEYAKVIYFAAPSIRASLSEMQVAGQFENLEVRPLPGQPDRPHAKMNRYAYEPSVPAREMLDGINEEGHVARAQLPRFLGWDEERVEEVLKELSGNHCLRNGCDQDGDGGWVWCSRRGANRSTSDLAPPPPPGIGGLTRRFVLMEVRIALLAEFPGSSWVTRRRLRQGRKGNRPELPDGVLVRGGRRYAVVFLQTRRGRPAVARLFNRWKDEYAGVLCYRTRNLSNWLGGVVSAYELDWVDVRDLPAPPEGSPYDKLEDNSPTAIREASVRALAGVQGSSSYVPTEGERVILRLASSEGSVSRLQLPRAAGCTQTAAEDMVERLRKQGFLTVEDGWIRSTKAGSDASGTGLPVARFRLAEAYIEERFHVMELRLSLEQPASFERWRTRRQLAREMEAPPGVMGGLPQGAALIDGEWHAIGLFLSEHRCGTLAKRLSAWRESFPRARCYCMEVDVEAFERFIARWGLSGVEAMPIPESRDPVARERQAAALAAVLVAREQREIERQPQLAARRRVSIALQRGELEKPDTCEACRKRVGTAGVKARYTDYSRPLEVEWLCMKCHRAKNRARRQEEPREGAEPK